MSGSAAPEKRMPEVGRESFPTRSRLNAALRVLWKIRLSERFVADLTDIIASLNSDHE